MALNMLQHKSLSTPIAGAGVPRAAAVPRPSRVAANATPKSPGRWRAIDADMDMSDDQQDIQRARGMTDELFQGGGGMGGTNNPILSSHDYISMARTSFNNIEDGYYISPAFLDKMTVHIAKNFMDLPKVKVPLILGIWGGKGQGKTFQCALAYKKMGIAPIVMSAGELESGNAGEPAKLMRQRYREASDIIKKGKMCSLFINDLDAGAGRMGEGTQYTVNNQMVNATLMNIADNPTNVQLPGMYNQDEIPRVPIVATGNDFSTLYAPLIRDGRMEKYYWNPTREDRIGVCMGIFMEDDVNRQDVEELVDAFPGQSIDFFGALRSRVYDDMVRGFISTVGLENLGKRLVNSREGKVTFEKPSMTKDILMEFGKMVVAEQENVKRVQLADAYLGGAELAGASGTSMPEDIAAEAPAASWNGGSPRATSPRRPLEVSPEVDAAIKQQQAVRGGGSASPPSASRYESPARSAPPPPPRGAAPAGGNGGANSIEELAGWISSKYMGMGKTAMDALPELRRMGVTSQGPNQFSVKGTITDAPGVASVLRLTPRR